MFRLTLTLTLALALAACADQRAQREAVLRPLVGASETDLIRSVGVPTRTFEAAGRRFLAYNETTISLLPGFPGFYPGFPGYGYTYGLGYGTPPTLIERKCETTFEVSDGRVLAFALRGNACG